MNAIRPTRVRCPGCESEFTPRGLSQHVSRTEDSRCRDGIVTSQSHLVSAAFPRMASPPTLSPSWASQIAGETNELTQGEFAVTRVATHAAALRKFCRW